MTKTRADVTVLLAEAPVLAVFGGVDTHGRVHVAAAVDQLGRVLGSSSFAASAAGYQALRCWLVAFGALVAVGVEGTGSYGAGLAHCLSEAGVAVVEVDRPDRAGRRRAGKDDTLDAISAACAVASGRATAQAEGPDRGGRGDPGAAGRALGRGQGPHRGVQPGVSLQPCKPRMDQDRPL
ncbi:MAG: IS110 family transposase [Pseudonocardiaceae bacterium]